MTLNGDAADAVGYASIAASVLGICALIFGLSHPAIEGGHRERLAKIHACETIETDALRTVCLKAH